MKNIEYNEELEVPAYIQIGDLVVQKIKETFLNILMRLSKVFKYSFNTFSGQYSFSGEYKIMAKDSPEGQLNFKMPQTLKHHSNTINL